jgi:hypothetical protein
MSMRALLIIVTVIGIRTHPVLTVTAFAAVWLIRAYFASFAGCGWCGGTGLNLFTRLFRLRTRRGNCWRCKGSGQRQVLGSRQVHRAVRAIRGREPR